ncbi:ankyrin repeat protein [Fontibacillus phaseoli]|uniref:Ankyrin repeat protein n=1 Tax=Fontibacillus phaseoli TaxID=1416533 RepID=A0A369BQ73_9BACL|nr:DUF4274 domain-containing protein [Fontibacillus phaseoli]RCX23779.1 ankyrin repeat protein [Fontibacillus phaseoli]
MNWTEISRSKDIEAVRTAVAELDANERDDRGRTPLMLFITNRMPIHAIELLIREGADLEAEDKLRDTALKKAVKFKQKEAIAKLLEAGVRLDSPQGILATAWNAARGNKGIADMLLKTKGAVRLTLLREEDEIVDDILYDELQENICKKIVSLDSPVLLHAVVNGYNWDDGPEPMLCAYRNPALMEITMLDMYDLLDGDYWLEQDGTQPAATAERKGWKELAAGLKERLEQIYPA